MDRINDTAIVSFCAISAYYHIASDPEQLKRELSLQGKSIIEDDILRAAQLIGLKARVIEISNYERLTRVPVPAIAKRKDGIFVIFGGKQASGKHRFVDPVSRQALELDESELSNYFEPILILITRKIGGTGADPQTFNLRWFLPSILRYRKPLAHVMLASFFVQIFALVTPLFFQVVIDKVLSHKGYETLIVIVCGILFIGIFDVILQYLRSYALTHTTNRIDVELGRRLFFTL